MWRFVWAESLLAWAHRTMGLDEGAIWMGIRLRFSVNNGLKVTTILLVHIEAVTRSVTPKYEEKMRQAWTMNKTKQFTTNTIYFLYIFSVSLTSTYTQGVNRMPHENNTVARATAKPPESPEYTLATNYVILHSSIYICMKKKQKT